MGEKVREVRHDLFGSDPLETVFERFEFLSEGFDVVERDLDGAVVYKVAESVHFLLFFPCCCCLWVRLGEEGGGYKDTSPDLRNWM